MLRELQVGVVLRPHGVKGEVKVYVTSEDPDRLSDLESVHILGPKTDRTAKIENVRYFKNTAIVKFEGIDTMDDTAPILRCELLIPREEALPLGENEYYVGDLIGLTVIPEDGEVLGELTDVLATGANDVYEVTRPDGSKVLLPAIRECILGADLEEGVMRIHLMKGLV